MSADFDPYDSEAGHTLVLAEAIDIFVERNARYQDLWRTASAEDQLMMMRHKLSRVEQARKLGQPGRDDLLDMINYAVFYIRNGYADVAP